MNKAKNLAEAHWEYIKKLLLNHELESDVVDIIGFHYTTAFIHGYKHGQEQLIEDYKTSKDYFKAQMQCNSCVKDKN